MTRRRLRFVIALLLPLMALRAMLPAGYMLNAAQGELRIVMCSAVLSVAATSESDSSREHSPLPNTGDCAFAHTAASAPVIQFIVADFESLHSEYFVSLTTDRLPPATGPPRVAAARAPPGLS